MSMKLPADLLTTKAAATEKPVIEDIRVALYGSSGYLQAYTLAKPVDEDGTPGAYPTASDPILVDEGGNESEDGTEKVYYFQVDLPVYEGLAFVHVIANGPATLPFDGAYETSYMDTLSTGYSSGVLQGAYWDSFVLEDGIVPEKENGEIKLVNGHYIPSEATEYAFQEIKLIRNFAQIVLKNSSSQLTDVSFKIINTPRRGSIAVVDKDSDSGLDRIFIEDYEDYTFKTTGNDGFIRNGGTTYYGYASNYPVNESVPSSAEAAAADQTFIPLDATTKTGSAFVFERPSSETKPTYILLRGRFNDPGDGSVPFSYYRVDIKNESLVEESSGNGFIPIYRNYRYNFTINNVGKAGAENPADAATHDSGGNVSLSVEASKLTDISDGLSRLYVEYIEKNFLTGVDPEGTTTPTTVEGTIWASYEPVAGGNVINTNVTVLGPYTVRVDGEDVPAAIKDVDGDDITVKSDADGHKTFSFQLKRQTDVDQVSTFRIKAENTANGSVLYRLVTVRVLKIQEMEVSGEPDHANSANTSVQLNIKIDGDLPASLFPLQFFIEDSRKTITPTGKDAADNSIEVPVKFDESKPDSYQYVRTVNLDEYNNLVPDSEGKVTVTTMFKTISDDCYTEVTVSNEYFKDDTYILYGAFQISGSFANSSLGVGAACPLTINISRPVAELTVRLRNCEPSAAETRLTQSGTDGEYTVYTFTPDPDDDALSMTFDLVTTELIAAVQAEVVNSGGDNESTGTMTGTRPTTISIAAGALRLDGNSNYVPTSGYTVYVRRATNVNNNITTFYASTSNQVTSNSGNVSINFGNIPDYTKDTYIYFAFSRGNNGRNLRWARATIEDLINGNVTLSFQTSTNF